MRWIGAALLTLALFGADGSAAPVSTDTASTSQVLPPGVPGDLIELYRRPRDPALQPDRHWDALFRTDKPVYDLWGSLLDCYERA